MAEIVVDRLSEFRGNDLADMCDAAEAAITAGGGFGWLKPPRRDVMESCWCQEEVFLAVDWRA